MSFRFKKQERFYHLYQQTNFFGGITVACVWGTFDSSRGGYKYIFCANIREALLTLENIKNTRLKRGYKPY